MTIFQKPLNAYDRVVPRLHQGSAPPVGVRLPFDVLVLCAQEYQPSAENYRAMGDAPLQVLRCPIDDANPTKQECVNVLYAARQVASALKARKRVLVTCLQGRNRSGFVVCTALAMLGMPVEESIARVRAARGPTALSNQHFVRCLRTLTPPRRIQRLAESWTSP